MVLSSHLDASDSDTSHFKILTSKFSVESSTMPGKIISESLRFGVGPFCMYIDLGPFAFEIDPAAIAGAALWSMGLYLGLSPQAGSLTDRITIWMGNAERSLYATQKEFDDSRTVREAQNTFYSSLLSVIPFLVVGTVLSLVVNVSLGEDWVFSGGLLTVLTCGVYDLGRRNDFFNDEDDDEDED